MAKKFDEQSYNITGTEHAVFIQPHGNLFPFMPITPKDIASVECVCAHFAFVIVNIVRFTLNKHALTRSAQIKLLSFSGTIRSISSWPNCIAASTAMSEYFMQAYSTRTFTIAGSPVP